MSAAPADGADRPLEPELEEIGSLLLDRDELVRAVAAGRRRNAAVPYRRVELRYVDVRGAPRLQITAYDDTQARVSNETLGEAAESAVAELLRQPFANWHVETRTRVLQLRITKRGRLLLHRERRTDPQEQNREHNRPKQRRLREGDELFHILGLATADGRIKASRQSKYRQIEDFLAALDAVVTDQLLERLTVRTAAGSGRPLRLVDLGCGNAYLTFAAFRYLTSVRGIDARAVGVDLKAAARSHNEQIAERLNIDSCVTFLDRSITDASLEEEPDVVLALHACDTATDDALARAVQWRTPVILAAPCCHHDVQRQLSGRRAPEPYSLLTGQPILRERFADVLTDSLRATILRLVGYRAEVVEFCDPDSTPRNTLIRAVRTEAAPPAADVRSYARLVSEWNLRPALAERLALEHPSLRIDDLDSAGEGSRSV